MAGWFHRDSCFSRAIVHVRSPGAAGLLRVSRLLVALIERDPSGAETLVSLAEVLLEVWTAPARRRVATEQAARARRRGRPLQDVVRRAGRW